jgi:hypothetical protein
VLVQGHASGTRDDVPPVAEANYHEFYYDLEDRLQLVVFYPTDARPFVSDKLFYSGKYPLARASYSSEGLSYIDYVYYEQTYPAAACRYLQDGRIVLLTEMRNAGFEKE